MTDLTSLRSLVLLAIDTVRDPREGAAEVLRIAPPRPVLWMAFALMVVMSLIVGESMVMFLGQPEEGPLTGQSTLVLGLVQGAFLFLTIFAITHIGQAFGGTGQFDGTLALLTWLQFVFLLIQLVQLALLLVAPPLAGIVTILAIGLFFWLLVNFITVLHGFQSTGMVFVMTIVSFITIIFVLSIVLTILGFTFEASSLSNEL